MDWPPCVQPKGNLRGQDDEKDYCQKGNPKEVHCNEISEIRDEVPCPVQERCGHSGRDEKPQGTGEEEQSW